MLRQLVPFACDTAARLLVMVDMRLNRSCAIDTGLLVLTDVPTIVGIGVEPPLAEIHTRYLLE